MTKSTKISIMNICKITARKSNEFCGADVTPLLYFYWAISIKETKSERTRIMLISFIAFTGIINLQYNIVMRKFLLQIVMFWKVWIWNMRNVWCISTLPVSRGSFWDPVGGKTSRHPVWEQRAEAHRSEQPWWWLAVEKTKAVTCLGVAICSSSGGWLGPGRALIYTQSCGATGHTVKKPSRTGAFSPSPLPQGLLIRRTGYLKEGGIRELHLCVKTHTHTYREKIFGKQSRMVKDLDMVNVNKIKLVKKLTNNKSWHNSSFRKYTWLW